MAVSITNDGACVLITIATDSSEFGYAPQEIDIRKTQVTVLKSKGTVFSIGCSNQIYSFDHSEVAAPVTVDASALRAAINAML